MPILDLTVSQGGSCKLPASPLIDQLSALVRSEPHANAQEKKVHRNRDSQRGFRLAEALNEKHGPDTWTLISGRLLRVDLNNHRTRTQTAAVLVIHGNVCPYPRFTWLP